MHVYMKLTHHSYTLKAISRNCFAPAFRSADFRTYCSVSKLPHLPSSRASGSNEWTKVVAPGFCGRNGDHKQRGLMADFVIMRLKSVIYHFRGNREFARLRIGTTTSKELELVRSTRDPLVRTKFSWNLCLCFAIVRMNSDHRVETMSRLVQWCINSFSCPNKASMTRNYTLDSIHISDYFIIGKWKWRFVLSETKEYMKFKLSPEVPVFEAPVIASFNIRVISFLAGRKTFIHPEIRDMRLKRGDYEFKWTLDGSLTAGSVIIEAEFLDLKSIPPNGGEPHSIWSDGYKHLSTNSPALKLLGKSLSDSIDTDITIYASDGNIRAHRWVLKTRSPVFERMFSYDFKENEMSTINIPDMSIEVCKSFLGYMYFNLQYQDFIDHRLDLLIAADKYYVSDLKDECEKSLIEDINTTNVLERLQFASMYRVSKLKVSCIQYLVKFGKFLDIKEEFRAFMKCDSELAAELIDEMISFGKDFCKCF